MREINECWYTMTNRDEVAFSTTSKVEARRYLREGWEVVKTTQKIFVSGPSNVYLTVNTSVKEAKDL